LNKFLEIPDNPVTVLLRPSVSRWKLYKWYSIFGSHEPSLGLLYLASYIESNGFKVKILDGEILKNRELITALIYIKPEIIGITTTTFSFFNAVKLTIELRSLFPDCVIIFGGSHITALPEDTMKRINNIDGVVVGDGEETILEIIKKYNTEQIDGLVWRANSDSKIITNKKRELNANLDKYKLNWGLLDGFPQNYSPPYQSGSKKSASLVISRGCFYDCSFCSSNLIMGKTIRFHSPEYVVDLMSKLEYDYQIKDFYFHDDYLPVYSHWIIDFCNILLKKKQKFTWACVSRVELLSGKILEMMKRSGCRQIGIGVESASQKILDKISKRTSVQILREGIKRISTVKINIKGFFILDVPGESFKDILKTIRFILSSKFSEIQINYYVPLPGSRDYLKYNPDTHVWPKMSLQHCLGYSKINSKIYPFIEITIYLISYTKIVFIRILYKIRTLIKDQT